jgi:quinol monooxygenase YgiN
VTGPPNKRMKLTRLSAAPGWLSTTVGTEVPPRARAGRIGAGTASQLIRGVRRTLAAGGMGGMLVVIARPHAWVLFLLATVVVICQSPAFGEEQRMLVRISEIQVDPEDLKDYRAILTEEAEASVRLEPGVVSIFPMYQRESPTEVRILEIYASREAYEAHLKTPHFQHYKTATAKMVKSLRLVDMEVMDTDTMTTIFRRMK